MTDPDAPDPSAIEKLEALVRVARFRPLYAGGVVGASVVAALLEAFGLGFILPIVEVARYGSGGAEATGRLLGVFLEAYAVLDVPFTLGYLVGGVGVIMAVRFTSSFLVGWLRGSLETRYVRHLQETAFDEALDAEVAYFDGVGSDEILDTIVTQAEYAGEVIRDVTRIVEQSCLCGMYGLVALYIAPVLTIATAVFFGGATLFSRAVLETGYSLGDEVADAKGAIQATAQAGSQGIREVKLFGMAGEFRSGFRGAVRRYEEARIRLVRNKSAIRNFYQLGTALAVFALIYVGLAFSSLSVGELGIFLFAMFRLGPKLSTLNKQVYRAEGQLPHLVRTQAFIDAMDSRREAAGDGEPVPDPVETVAFEDVAFGYGDETSPVLSGVDLAVDRSEVVAVVGPSGAGKSTLVGLLARFYDPDEGAIRADGVSIDAFDLAAWRSRVAVVRQDPYIFDETLRWNVTVADREASREQVERACEIARVTEFLDDLPDGYDTTLGDQGVKLSGGQRQRVAIARALLKDADVLVLDEATSDLDSSLEREVHEAIRSADRDYATLVIAHRLSTVTDADRIYALRDGRVVESGSHAELMNRGGVYSRLYSLQSP